MSMTHQLYRPEQAIHAPMPNLSKNTQPIQARDKERRDTRKVGPTLTTYSERKTKKLDPPDSAMHHQDPQPISTLTDRLEAIHPKKWFKIDQIDLCLQKTQVPPASIT
jgi:hypothetical protein